MKQVNLTRSAIETIPDVFYPDPPVSSPRGPDDQPRTLWTPYGQALESDLPHDEEEPLPPEEVIGIGDEIDEGEVSLGLQGEAGTRIRHRLQISGVDALAWYVTFHFRGEWGIYIPISSLLYMAVKVFGDLNTDLETRIRLGFRALHRHELFHFAADCMSAQWECIAHEPCHKPARSLRCSDGYILLEEQLANAYMIRSFRGGRSSLRIAGRTPALREFTFRQPEGYREGGEITSIDHFEYHLGELARRYVACMHDFDQSRLYGVDLKQFYPIIPGLDWRQCPIHIVHDEYQLGIARVLIDLFRTVDEIDEPKAFLKQLRRMPKRIQRAWAEAKRKLAISTDIGGLDFKRWKKAARPDEFSVRLTAGYRAHVVYLREQSRWFAAAIGTHKEMGHG